MKKEEVYVVIDSEEKRLRAIKILSDAGEDMGVNKEVSMRTSKNLKYLVFYCDETWLVHINNHDRQEISLDQLEQLLSPKQEPMKLDALKLIAESYGFELVEKKFYKNIKRFIIWKSHKKNKRSLDVNFLIL